MGKLSRSLSLSFFLSLSLVRTCFLYLQALSMIPSELTKYNHSQVPSSINRVYSLIHPSLVSLPFTYASGIVLPLMGFWNAVIYVTTSWAAVRLLFSGKLDNGSVGSAKRGGPVGGRSGDKPSWGVRKWTWWESESTKGLAGERGSGFDQV